MSGAPKLRSMNVAESEARPVLVPAGNKARSPASGKKPAASKNLGKVEVIDEEKKKKGSNLGADPKSSNGSYSAASILRRQEWLLKSNLSLNASCSSDASTDSFVSRASTGRIGRAGFSGRRRQSSPRPEKIAARIIPNMESVNLAEPGQGDGKRRCSWVTSNTDPCYAAFHDEEWGVPVHDDKKLFELLVLSSALAELTWPAILSKRNIFREVFMDFDPVLVAKLNEKKIIAQGSTASSLLSEAKLRAVIENALQVLKIIEEFGSFDKYCWSFVNQKPIITRFRYSRQVPVKTPKADTISKDLMRRGFRSVGPTVIYSFMQAAGITNDHLISCYRFEECASAAERADDQVQASNNKCTVGGGEGKGVTVCEEMSIIGLEFARAVDDTRNSS
ncbi:uncharacterized protein A4U43_C05F33840 [Asparagus officinalis]|uniref:Uncharacterized protein n=1 Tax=Asparagus officinalis TaxID=4686 RepID=A0A5P1F0Y5_ASPOF|nr:uncharacterized protein A4U43_C05F33840 [Asparagus officinalis]